MWLIGLMYKTLIIVDIHTPIFEGVRAKFELCSSFIIKGNIYFIAIIHDGGKVKVNAPIKFNKDIVSPINFGITRKSKR